MNKIKSKSRVFVLIVLALCITLSVISLVIFTSLKGKDKNRFLTNNEKSNIELLDSINNNSIVNPTSISTEQIWNDQLILNGDFEQENSFDTNDAYAFNNSLTFMSWLPSANVFYKKVTNKNVISGGKSLVFETPGYQGALNLAHDFFTGGNNAIKPGTEGITFKIKTNKDITIIAQLIDRDENFIVFSNANTTPITIKASSDVQTICVNFDTLISNGKNPFNYQYSRPGASIYTDYTQFKLKFDAITDPSIIYFDDFTFTKKDGFQKPNEYSDFAIANGDFETDNVLNGDITTNDLDWTKTTSGDTLITQTSSKSISGTKSLLFSSSTKIDGTKNYVTKNFSNPTQHIKKDTEGITFQLDSKDNGFLTFKMIVNGQPYKKDLHFKGKKDVQTFTILYSEFLSDINQPMTSLGDTLFTSNQIYMSIGYTSTQSSDNIPSEIILDNFMQTKALGYNIQPILNYYKINVTTNNATLGSAIGAKTIKKGKTATITAYINNEQNAKFKNWTDSLGNIISTAATYSFISLKDETYTANFEEIPQLVLTVNKADSSSIDSISYYYYAQKVTVTTSPLDNTYTFLGWVNNKTKKIISTDLTYSFNITNNMDITPKYVQNQYIVRYIDIDGRIISTQGVINTMNATKPTMDPFKPGYKFIGWSHNGQNITKNTDIKAMFEKTTFYTVTVKNGKLQDNSTTGNFQIATLISVTHDTAPTDKIFSHWETSDGKILSYDEVYVFVLDSNISVNAVFVNNDTSIETHPFITLENEFDVNQTTKSITFTSKINSLTAPYTLVECGLLLYYKELNSELTLNTTNVTKATSSKQEELTGQFQTSLINAPPNTSISARAYMIYKDSTGKIFTIYSENTIKYLTI